MSEVECYFCKICGFYFWVWDLCWLEFLYFYVGVIDMLLLKLFEMVYIMLKDKLDWIELFEGLGYVYFDSYFDKFIEDWYKFYGFFEF